MHEHVMDAESAIELLTALGAGGVDVRLCGGWAVDALLGEQTRVHADLDLWVESTQFEQVITVLAHVGVDRLYPWGDERPWNFALHDGARRRIDLHAYEHLRNGSIHYGGCEVGETYPLRCTRRTRVHQRRRCALRLPRMVDPVAHRLSSATRGLPRRRSIVRTVRSRTPTRLQLRSSSADR